MQSTRKLVVEVNYQIVVVPINILYLTCYSLPQHLSNFFFKEFAFIKNVVT